MTKQEIIDKINTGIRGQGSQVDIGGVLGDILEAILDASDGGILDTTGYDLVNFQGTRAEMAQFFHITEEQLTKLINGHYIAIRAYHGMNIIGKTGPQQITFYDSTIDGLVGYYALGKDGTTWILSEI